VVGPAFGSRATGIGTALRIAEPRGRSTTIAARIAATGDATAEATRGRAMAM
jgi:hypothetical protein